MTTLLFTLSYILPLPCDSYPPFFLSFFFFSCATHPFLFLLSLLCHFYSSASSHSSLSYFSPSSVPVLCLSVCLSVCIFVSVCLSLSVSPPSFFFFSPKPFSNFIQTLLLLIPFSFSLNFCLYCT